MKGLFLQIRCGENSMFLGNCVTVCTSTSYVGRGNNHNNAKLYDKLPDKTN